MSSLETELIVADEVCLTSQSFDETNLLREANLSFEEWWLNQSLESPREITFEGTLRVDGYVPALLRYNDGKLLLDEDGEVDGNAFVTGAVMRVVGRGEIRATGRVELSISA